MTEKEKSRQEAMFEVESDDKITAGEEGKGQKTRRSGRKKPGSYIEMDTDQEDAVVERPSKATKMVRTTDGVKPQPRHGRCGVVTLVLSNQRPAQEQFTAGDFLDDEPSGDEDYRD